MRSALSFGLAAATFVSLACSPAAPPQPAEPGYNLVIEGGRVVDGTGSAWFFGDVAVSGDRIARVVPAGTLAGASADRRIDARGMVVAPGFIDIQSHSRSALLVGDGRVLSKITQGVTTEIMGEGSTNAPMSDRTLAVATDIVDPDLHTLAADFVGQGGFDRWLRAMEARGTSVNVGSFVGAATIRSYGMGADMGTPPPAALDSMRKAVRWAMEEGAFGVASALIYPPGNYATTAELVEIGRAMAPYGGLYITHMRSEADQVLEAMDEAIRIGREASVPVEIFHLKAAGQRNHAKMPVMIEKIDSARVAGLDVQANIYPYAAGGTGLSACMPPDASEGGRLYERLADPEERTRIRREILTPGTKEWENLCELSTPEGVMVLGFEREENRRWAGMRLSDVAAAMGTDWVDAAMELLVSEGQRISTIFFMMSEENVRLGLSQPWIKIGTDAGGLDPTTATDLAHPRAYGTYPRILGRYVREQGALTLEEAVRKMTSAVATRLSIGDRGVLRPGMYADISIFDPDLILDRATFEDPHQLSVGVRDVLVNGVAVLQGGVHTGATPGRVVRGSGYRSTPPADPR